MFEPYGFPWRNRVFVSPEPPKRQSFYICRYCYLLARFGLSTQILVNMMNRR
jgi:hypothetical protein